jgi:Centromere protein H (CENP-H)
LRIQRRRQHQQSDFPSNKATVLREHRLLQSKVMEESARQQKNVVLLQRMAMAQPAKEVAWVHQSTVTDDDDNDNETEIPILMGQDYWDWRILVHETVRCRNELATRNLQTSRQLDTVRQKLSAAMQEGEQLQKLTNEAWEALKPYEQERRNVAHMEQVTDQYMGSEIVLLKGIVQDLIVAGNLDWDQDERLREAFESGMTLIRDRQA